ncbi:MAG: hypothetical protein ABH881_00765, partial [bacterium]
MNNNQTQPTNPSPTNPPTQSIKSRNLNPKLVFAVLLILLIGVGGFFVWQNYQIVTCDQCLDIKVQPDYSQEILTQSDKQNSPPLSEQTIINTPQQAIDLIAK